jgi:hypothetical protein
MEGRSSQYTIDSPSLHKRKSILDRGILREINCRIVTTTRLLVRRLAE